MLDALYSVCFAMVAIFGVNLGTNQPPYELVARINDRVEIRTYPVRLVAEITLPDNDRASNDGFSKLAGYIFGANQERRKMAMTTPVEIQRPAVQEVSRHDGTMTMRFFLPADMTLATLPRPDDAKLVLSEIPPMTVAVYRFSGLSDQRNSEEIAALESVLAKTRWIPSGRPTAYYYNPPWTLPFLRRNELVLPVTHA
jgi:hypothetical protein